MDLKFDSFQLTTVSNTPADKWVCSLTEDGQRVLIIVHGGGVDDSSPAVNNYTIGGDAPVTPGGVALLHRVGGSVAILQESIPITATGSGPTVAINIAGDDINLRFTGPGGITYHHCVSFGATRFT